MAFGFFIGLTAAALGARAYIAARSQRRYAACIHNLSDIANAAEMYSTDYAGRYPPRLSLLTPTYLKAIPTCPEAGSDTYSASFESHSIPDCYTFYCSGENHAWAELQQ